jgi:hypothetical protein
MYDDNDENTCQICLEIYEPSKRIPKRLECCNQVYCLQCLEDIFKKNKDFIQCPICRSLIKKSPKDLKVVKEALETKQMVTCPTCYKSIKSAQLKLTIIDSQPSILCNNCCQDGDSLDTYLINLLDEMSYFQSAFCNYDTRSVEKELEKITQNCIDNVVNRLKAGLYEKLKSRLDDLIHTKILTIKLEELNSKVNQLGSIICEMKSIKEVRNVDYPMVIGSIDFYIKNNELLKINSQSLNKFVHAAQSCNDFIALDEKVKYNEIEDFMERLFVVKVKNNSFKLFEDDNGDVGYYKTGIHYIDSKLSDAIELKDLKDALIDINRVNSFNNGEKTKYTPFDDID